MKNLEYLLEQENLINEKIKSGLKTLKEWFEQKTEQIKETLSKIASKISSKLNKNIICKKDIPEANIKKGDKGKELLDKIKKMLNSLKESGDSIIDKCKNGLRKISQNKVKEAEEEKNKCKSLLNKFSSICVRTLCVLGAVNVVSQLK